MECILEGEEMIGGARKFTTAIQPWTAYIITMDIVCVHWGIFAC